MIGVVGETIPSTPARPALASSASRANRARRSRYSDAVSDSTGMKRSRAPGSRVARKSGSSRWRKALNSGAARPPAAKISRTAASSATRVPDDRDSLALELPDGPADRVHDVRRTTPRTAPRRPRVAAGRDPRARAAPSTGGSITGKGERRVRDRERVRVPAVSRDELSGTMPGERPAPVGRLEPDGSGIARPAPRRTDPAVSLPSATTAVPLPERDAGPRAGAARHPVHDPAPRVPGGPPVRDCCRCPPNANSTVWVFLPTMQAMPRTHRVDHGALPAPTRPGAAGAAPAMGWGFRKGRRGP